MAGFLAAGTAFILLAGCATPQDAALLAQPRISREQAARAALAQAPGGRIREAELAQESGKLIWWFDITTPGSKNLTEVNVDAFTGGVISVATEISEP